MLLNPTHTCCHGRRSIWLGSFRRSKLLTTWLSSSICCVSLAFCLVTSENRLGILCVSSVNDGDGGGGGDDDDDDDDDSNTSRDGGGDGNDEEKVDEDADDVSCAGSDACAKLCCCDCSSSASTDDRKCALARCRSVDVFSAGCGASRAMPFWAEAPPQKALLLLGSSGGTLVCGLAFDLPVRRVSAAGLPPAGERRTSTTTTTPRSTAESKANVSRGRGALPLARCRARVKGLSSVCCCSSC